MKMKTVNTPGYVIVQRSFSEPYDDSQSCFTFCESAACVSLFGVSLVESYLSRDRDRMICLFEAPDAESVRCAINGSGLSSDAVWAGRHRELRGGGAPNLVVEGEVPPETVKWYGASVCKLLVSYDQRKTISVLSVPDELSVINLGRELQLSGYVTWACVADQRPPRPRGEYRNVHASRRLGHLFTGN